MTGESAFPPVIGGNLKTSGPPKRIVGEREVAMKYAGLLILLASTLMPSQDTAKFYLVAVDGSYSVSVDGVTTKIEGKHYIQQEVVPGRHAIGYQIGYFGDWTATSPPKAIAGQNYYFVFSSAPGSGRMFSQLSSSQGRLCLRAMENRGGTEPCRTIRVNNLYPSLQFPPSGNLVPWGFHTNHPR